MALILRYFAEFSSFRAHCVKLVEDVVVKNFTFAISSDEFLVDCVVVLIGLVPLLQCSGIQCTITL